MLTNGLAPPQYYQPQLMSASGARRESYILATEGNSLPRTNLCFQHETLTSFNIDLYDIGDRKSFG